MSGWFRPNFYPNGVPYDIIMMPISQAPSKSPLEMKNVYNKSLAHYQPRVSIDVSNTIIHRKEFSVRGSDMPFRLPYHNSSNLRPPPKIFNSSNIKMDQQNDMIFRPTNIQSTYESDKRPLFSQQSLSNHLINDTEQINIHLKDTNYISNFKNPLPVSDNNFPCIKNTHNNQLSVFHPSEIKSDLYMPRRKTLLPTPVSGEHKNKSLINYADAKRPNADNLNIPHSNQNLSKWTTFNQRDYSTNEKYKRIESEMQSGDFFNNNFVENKVVSDFNISNPLSSNYNHNSNSHLKSYTHSYNSRIYSKQFSRSMAPSLSEHSQINFERFSDEANKSLEYTDKGVKLHSNSVHDIVQPMLFQKEESPFVIKDKQNKITNQYLPSDSSYTKSKRENSNPLANNIKDEYDHDTYSKYNYDKTFKNTSIFDFNRYRKNQTNYSNYKNKDNNYDKYNNSSKHRYEQNDDKDKEDENENQRIEKETRELEEMLERDGLEDRIADWIRSSPADLYFKRNLESLTVESTKRMKDLENKFQFDLLERNKRVRAANPPVVVPERIPKCNMKKIDEKKDQNIKSSKKLVKKSDEDSEVEVTDDFDYDEDVDGKDKLDIIHWKNMHPEKLHDEMWFNIPGEMNDGPLCKCTGKAKLHGIRHNIYPGEHNIKKCDPNSNNFKNLYHYRITMSPHTNFLTKFPTIVNFDSHEYIFEGFSLFSHYKLEKVPTCKVIRFNIEYTIHWFEEEMIENYDIRSLDMFCDFLFGEILELVDLDWIDKDSETCCRCFHFMPRFSRDLPDNGKEILSMSEVLKFLLESSKPLLDEIQLGSMLHMESHEWLDFVDEFRGMIVTYPGKRPNSLRIDQLDREQKLENVITYPTIVHFGYRPAQLSYVADHNYNKIFKQYMKLKYLVSIKPKLNSKDKERLRNFERTLQDIRMKGTLKREMTVELSSEGFIKTGLRSDICQHALLLPVLVQHLRFHRCLSVLEESIGYSFKDRLFLQMAMTHPSFRMNFGTNPDHARNSLTNCGMRQLHYGNRHIHFIHTRKRGIKTLMHIMSKMARDKETPSEIHHYERLEFLGDTVIEFLSSIHLFFLFPRLEEGGLATYRAALVQNQHLTVLAQKMGLQHFLLYAHGPDLCRYLDLRYALANCFEALMGSLFLDGGIEVADKVFGEALFKDEPELLYVWVNMPPHPIQADEPIGDRHWIEFSKPLQKLVKFEETTGFVFNHIRILARAFTMRNIGYNNLTFGHNQTLEFLGDTILQFITSDYLFKHFPDHHEGHLTLLRSSLVNNKTQAIICDDMGMTEYVINNDLKVKERMETEKNMVKDKADILEAFIGSLYVDQGLQPCKVFCQVCLYPRLEEFIMNQDWNDAKSQLQQCCLTLRDSTEGEPDIPIYKILKSTGPTNTRKYHIAVYFRGERLSTGIGHSIQQGEMNAATNALREKSDMFPHLLQTKQFLDWRFGGSENRKRRNSTRNIRDNNSYKHDTSDHQLDINDSKFSSSNSTKIPCDYKIELEDVKKASGKCFKDSIDNNKKSVDVVNNSSTEGPNSELNVQQKCKKKRKRPKTKNLLDLIKNP